jgi:beta-lactamase regulating signal transducer with metallopeptidase domain
MKECCYSMTSMDFLGMTLIHSISLIAIGSVFVELVMARVPSARSRCSLATTSIIMMPALLGLAYFGVRLSWLPFMQPVFVAGTSLTTWVARVFVVGVAVQLSRLVVSVGCVGRLRRSSRSVSSLTLPEFKGGVGNVSIQISRSNAIAGPVTIGWLRPLILIPEHTIVNLDADQLALLVRHEMAHVSNQEYLWNLIQCVEESLVFYHPVVWLIGRAIRHERESAYDDMVVQSGVCKLDYSRALTSLEHLRSRWNPLLQPSNGASLLPRIQRLLHGRRAQSL